MSTTKYKEQIIDPTARKVHNTIWKQLWTMIQSKL